MGAATRGDAGGQSRRTTVDNGARRSSSGVIAPGLADTFPPLLSLESLPNSLARQVMPLIGRDDVLAEIEPLVLKQPLVTLIGTGGVGVRVSV